MEGGFYYRNPTTRGGVFSNDGGETLLIGSLTGATTCPTIALRDGNGNLLPYAGVNAALRRRDGGRWCHGRRERRVGRVVLGPERFLRPQRDRLRHAQQESENATLGLVWNSGNCLVTTDAYYIQVDDRIARTTDFDVTQAQRDALAAAGRPDLASLSRVGFFVNDFDTTTTGLDIVSSYDSQHFGGASTYSLAANWNETEVDDFTPGIISEARIKKIEDSLPSVKGFFSVNHQREVFHANVRVIYYGSFFEDHLDSDELSIANGGLPIEGDSAVTVDAEIGWNFASGQYVNLGAQNLFDKEPDRNPWAGVAGAEFPSHTPYGFNGGFYYARAGYRF